MLYLLCYTLNYNGVGIFSYVSFVLRMCAFGKSAHSDKLRDTIAGYIRV